MGRLPRRFGLTIDNLLAVELVTAHGEQIRASDDENADLFWAMRGAGANFGVVTAFEFRLHPMQPTVTRSLFVYPATRAAEVWSTFADFARRAPEHLNLALNISYALPANEYPDPIADGPVVTVGFMHSGDSSDVERDIAPLRKLGPAALESGGQMQYLDLQTSSDIEQSWGHRYYSKGGFVDELPADAIELVVEHVADGAGIGSFGVWAQGGAMARVPDDATAFTGRNAMFDVSADSNWDQAAQDDERIEWVRKAMSITEPYAAAGRYVNEQADTGGDVAQSVYGTAKMERLVALKRAWDPDNVFRMNQNIKP